MLETIWRELHDSKLPPWVTLGIILVFVFLLMVERVAKILSSIGIKVKTDASSVIELNEHVLRLRMQLDDERARVEHEIRSREAADEAADRLRHERDLAIARYDALRAELEAAQSPAIKSTKRSKANEQKQD